MTIGQRIRTRREELRLSQDELAKRVGYKSRSSINKIELDQRNMTQSVIKKIADALDTTPTYIMGWEDDPAPAQQTIIPYQPTGAVPILGSIPCGYPALAEQEVLGYETIEKPHPEEYYYLMVSGDSMIGAGLLPGDLALIHKQSYAEPGQIVACRVNGDEATLKRYREQDGVVILMPENTAYNPVLVRATDFVSGEAAILGVLVESKRKY